MKFAAGGGLLLLFSLLFNFGIFCYGFNSNRIINGTLAPEDKYHNVVRFFALAQLAFPPGADANVTKDHPPIFPMELPSCTGSIISKRHILTAAHCVLNGRLAEKKKILRDLGFLIEYIPNIPKREPPNKISLAKYGIVADFVVHDKFQWQYFEHDIAIIEFPKGYDLKIDPVILAKNYEEGENDIGVNVGFGDTDPAPDVSVPPKALMQANMPIFPAKDCIPSTKRYPVMCAGTPNHRSDHGDSGGPFFINGTDGKQYQIGTVSAGSMKNGTVLQDDAEMVTFMRISYYCDWIKEKTNGEAECVEMGKAAPTVAPVQGRTEAQKSADSGAMSKNIFVILFAFIFAFALILY